MVLPEDLLSGCDWRIRVLCNLYTTSKWQSLEHWGHMYTRSPLPPLSSSLETGSGWCKIAMLLLAFLYMYA